jgi:nucleoside 2-deoxyribosyltransferase
MTEGFAHYPYECGKHHGLVRDFGGERPRIVVLCGPARYAAEYSAALVRLVTAGCVVVGTPDLRGALDGAPAGAVEAVRRAHLRLIDLADEAHVVTDESGGFGDDTLSEIGYALAHGKPVTYANRAAAMRARDHGLLMQGAAS